MRMSAIYNDTYKLQDEHIYDGWYVPGFNPAWLLDEIKQYEFNDDEVLVSTYPKCGTSLMQAIAYLVLTEDFNHEKPLQQLVPYLELYAEGQGSGLDKVRKRETPGVIKTHLTPHFFEKTLQKKKTKFIIVIRNIKDVLVSYYHMYTMCILGYQCYKGTWNDFFELFKEDRLGLGNFFKVNLAWWEMRNDPRVLFVKYEDILKDPESNIQKVATFLGKSLSDETVKKIAAKTAFETMKQDARYNRRDETFLFDQSISPFLRRGKAGDWKNYFTKEQSDYCDELVEKYFKPVGLETDYE